MCNFFSQIRATISGSELGIDFLLSEISGSFLKSADFRLEEANTSLTSQRTTTHDIWASVEDLGSHESSLIQIRNYQVSQPVRSLLRRGKAGDECTCAELCGRTLGWRICARSVLVS